MNEPTPKDLMSSDYNEASFQILRLNNLWERANRYSKEGQFTKWNWELDNAWRELAQDAKLLNWDKYNLGMIEHRTKVLKAERQDKQALYDALNEKEIFLRSLQDEAGKGARRSDKGSNLM